MVWSPAASTGPACRLRDAFGARPPGWAARARSRASLKIACPYRDQGFRGDRATRVSFPDIGESPGRHRSCHNHGKRRAPRGCDDRSTVVKLGCKTASCRRNTGTEALGRALDDPCIERRLAISSKRQQLGARSRSSWPACGLSDGPIWEPLRCTHLASTGRSPVRCKVSGPRSTRHGQRPCHPGLVAAPRCGHHAELAAPMRMTAGAVSVPMPALNGSSSSRLPCEVSLSLQDMRPSSSPRPPSAEARGSFAARSHGGRYKGSASTFRNGPGRGRSPGPAGVRIASLFTRGSS